jgi:hypothetical protein
MRRKIKVILSGLVLVGVLTSAAYAYDEDYKYTEPPADDFRIGQTSSAKFSIHNGATERAYFKLENTSLRIDSDTNVYIAPNNNISAVFKANGYMGVGKSSAEYTLDLYAPNSGLNISGINSRISFGGERAMEGGKDGDNLHIGETYKNIFLRSSNGVGIGSYNPKDRLEVSKGSSKGGIWIHASEPMLTMETDAATHYNWRIAAQNNVDKGFEIQVGQADADASDDSFSTVFAVNNNGNVGIGTTMPSQSLHMKNVVGRTSLVLEGNKIGSDANYADIKGLNGANEGSLISYRRIGADDASGIVFYTSADSNGVVERMRIMPNGFIGIGDNNPQYKLSVAGEIAGTDIILSDQQNNWADHVFEKGYDLMPISKLEKFVKRNKHLPNVPSEKDIKKKAIGVAKMQGRLLEKVEELALYVIQLSNKIDAIEKENLKLRKKVKKLEKKK